MCGHGSRKGLYFMDKNKNCEHAVPSDFHPFTDDYIFMNVMRHPKICRGILELILPDEKFGAIRIMKSTNPFVDNSEIDEGAGESMNNGERISEPSDSFANLSTETQKTLKLEKDSHGVRFDAFVKTEQLWAEIEMQTGSRLALGRRARYYQANMDLDFLEQGNDYYKLKPSYIIFICTFDYYGADRPVYFFRSWDVENSLQFDDFSYKIVLNAACSPEKVPEKLKAFYGYLNNPEKNQASELTRMIDERVRKFNSGEWRRKYMTFEQILKERDRDSFARGLAEGEAAGLEKGRSEGIAQEKREIAKKFKQAGISIEVIAENTGLSAEEIKKL